MFAISRTTFTTYFSGNKEAYGQYAPPSISTESGSKEEGKSWTEASEITDAQYAAHLNGTTGLGICPVDSKGMCRFTVIDVDVYDKEYTEAILSLIEEYAFPLLPFRSKSGGLHLYTFYTDFVSAERAKEQAAYMRRCLSLKDTTEIFPKQSRLSAGKQGNWINLPYFGGSDSNRRVLHSGGKEVDSFDIAMNQVSAIATTLEAIEAWKSALPLNDAPPCLQAIYMAKETGARNNYLFNIGCYYKAKYKESFVEYIEEANSLLNKPIPEKELRDTVIASISKNDYTYRCKEPPICDLCDKKECRTRKYSVGEAISNISFEQLKQFTTDPPYYEWIVSGKVLRFYSEQEIIMQERFRALCFRHLGMLPYKLKQETWTDIVNAALLHMEVVAIDQDEELTDQGQVRSLVTKFLKETVSDQSSRLLLGRSYYCKDKSVTYFRGPDLIKYIATRVGYTADKRTLYAWLIEKGVTSTVLKVTGKAVRVYAVPDGALFEPEPRDCVDTSKIELLSFKDQEEQEAY